jgi:NADPH2:quinone reductase
MQAVWYEAQGPACEVLVFGDMDDVAPAAGEVRMRVHASAINPGDVKKRQNAFGVGMPFPRVIPHSDGAGVIDRVGDGVCASRLGQRVWCFGAQTYRPFGTAAGFVVLPSSQAVPLADAVSFEQGACLGIPGITAHRAVHAGGPVAGKTVLVQGGAGAVGQCAVGLARLGGARVVATARSDTDAAIAKRAGAHEVVRTDGGTAFDRAGEWRRLLPQGVDHIVEVAFGANIELDAELLANGGSIAAYATESFTPSIPFWPLVFKNVRMYFLGSDDFPPAAKTEAAMAMNDLLASGWPGLTVDSVYPLARTAQAHQRVESDQARGRVLVQVRGMSA